VSRLKALFRYCLKLKDLTFLFIRHAASTIESTRMAYLRIAMVTASAAVVLV